MATVGVRARQVWQVPVFLLGLIVLIGYLVARPGWTDPVVRAESRLDRARRLWENRDPHVRKILTLLQNYVDLAGPEGSRTAEAHLVWGCTLARAARQTGGTDAAPLWKQAWTHLRQSQTLRDTLQDGDICLMRAAMGEVGYHVGHTWRWVHHWLTRYQDYADDRAEVCRLLALVRLDAKTPLLEAALQANEQLRQLPLLGEDILGPARLQGGDILLRLRRHGEARKLLEKIGKEAPADLLARARSLRAESHQAESQWTEAAVLWQEMLEDRRRPLDDPARVRYQLGLCHRRLDQRDDAIRVWREAAALEAGATSSAAALGLAELVLPRTDDAGGGAELVDLLVRSVNGVHKSEDWNNLHASLGQARDLFEQACGVLRQKHNHARALELCEAYGKIAAAGRAAWQRGLTLREWARAVLEEETPDEARGLNLLKQAGEAFQTAADATTDRTEQAERLWLSAEGHSEGGEAAKAVTVLERFLKIEGQTPERLGEGWYRLALAQESLKNEAEAEAAHRRCMSYRSRYACRARFRLSQGELARGKMDRAAEMLDQNLRELRLNHDDEALEKSLYMLGHLLYLQKVKEPREKDPAAVRPILEEAVSKYPTSPSQVRGRFELAETYRLLAEQENQSIIKGRTLTTEVREHFLKQRRHWLTKAAEQFHAVSKIGTEEPVGPVGQTPTPGLTSGEQVQVSFNVAECRFNLGDYPSALKLYDDLAERYKHRLERLSALGGMARCYAAQRDFARFRERLDEIRVALQDVDEPTRRQWEAWLTIAGKGQ